jgi:hypothetical protein
MEKQRTIQALGIAEKKLKRLIVISAQDIDHAQETMQCNIMLIFLLAVLEPSKNRSIVCFLRLYSC